MLKKSITYENPFTNESVTEEHYFHISKADLVEMEMEEHAARYEKDGQTLTGMQAKLQKIVDAQDGKAIMAELKDLIRRSYGRKEGDRFIKSAAVWDDFSSTEAYSQLIFDLCTNAGVAGDFINGIVPHNMEKIAADVRAIAERQAKEGPTPVEAAAEAADAVLEGDDEIAVVPAIPEPRILTVTEATEMESGELQAGLADGRYKLSS